jgi:2',3'-cyclic-nucleotide 2'-phosphodiesterase (5'-nucleotidase family)
MVRVAAGISAAIEEAAADGTESIVLHGGDALTGTFYYSAFGTDFDSALLNELDIDVFVAGNHEFDDGDSNLADFTRKLNAPVLSYNCKWIVTTRRCSTVSRLTRLLFRHRSESWP